MYNTRNGPLLKLPDGKSTYYGINFVHFRACLSSLYLTDFPSLLNIVNLSLNLKENLKNWEMLTVLVFYVDEIVIVYCWFLSAFAICKHQRNIKL